jgi:cytochrome c oxidase subunit 2
MSWLLPQASTYAADIDNLILLIAVIVGAWFIAAELIFFWLIYRFRARSGIGARYIAGETKQEHRWVSYPHYAVLAFDIVILVVALRVWSDVKITAPQPDETVRIIAQQWAWTFEHAGPDGQFNTPDDIRTVEDLHLQQHRVYRFELHSRDVLHSFSVPAFRLKQDAVPGRMIAGWFTPTQLGTFDVQCAEICGIGHGLMPARVHVQTAAAYRSWMEERMGTPGRLAEGAAAATLRADATGAPAGPAGVAR